MDLISKSVVRDLSQDTYFTNLNIWIEDAELTRENLICLCKISLDDEQIYYMVVHLKMEPEIHIVDKQQLSYNTKEKVIFEIS